MAEKIVQTAGRSQLGEFAPEFAHFNDDVLFCGFLCGLAQSLGCVRSGEGGL